MNHPKRFLLANLAWSSEIVAREPQYFEQLAQGQRPRVLWIGCSDSRVPAERIVNAQPGELFVHRNIANLFCAEDSNVSSVVEYAVHALEVEHIIVCGHCRCGGVRAALGPPLEGLPHVNRHIAGLRELVSRHRPELEAIEDIDARADRVSQLNVVEQVRRIEASPILHGAKRAPQVHGWMFDVGEGRLLQLAHPERSA